MGHEELFKYIKEKGFRTKQELTKRNKGEDPEIVDMNLKYLLDKNKVHKIGFKDPSQSGEIYYIQDFKE